MEKIYKRMLWLSLMIVLSVNTVSAQAPLDVTPASGGTLPTDLPEIAPAVAGRLAALQMENIRFIGQTYCEADFRIVPASTYGGNSFYIYRRYEGENSWTLDWEEPIEHDFITSHLERNTYYRLVLAGGPYDGYVSNEVYVPVQKFGGSVMQEWTTRCSLENLIIGSLLRTTGLLIHQYGDPNPDVDEQGNPLDYKKYRNADGCFLYKWYRRNPNTGDLTAIEGATDEFYTPTIDDVGYEIVSAVLGDDVHVSFMHRYNHGLVRLPIATKVAYLDKHGFVLNTEYDLPEPGLNLFMTRKENGETVKEALGVAVTELKRGQYQVTMEKNIFEEGIVSFETANPYFLCFLYEQPYWDEEKGEYDGMELRAGDVQLYSEDYLRTLIITLLLNDVPTATNIDIIGKWVDGQNRVLATLTAGEANDGVFNTEIFKGKYYLRARKTTGIMDTYYPDALLWSETSAVETSENSWQTTSATINLLAAPAAMTGTGVVSGTVAKASSATRSGDDAETYTVFLRKAGTNKIVAETETDESGNYRFENVDLGTYDVLVDGIGCSMRGTHSAELTSENSVANNINYTVSGTDLIPSGELGDVTVTIGTYGKATFCSDKNLDLSGREDVKAYVATGYEYQGESSTIWMTRVKDVPAGTPVVLKGTPSKSYDIRVKATSSAYYKNLLVRGAGESVNATDGAGHKNYVMSGGKFVAVGSTPSSAIGTNKCYLQLPETMNATVAGSAQSLTLSATGTGKTTYCAPVDLDFTDVDGLIAYSATGYDNSTGTIWLTRVKKVSAGEGLLLKGTKGGNYTIPSVGIQSYYANMIVGNNGTSTISINSTDGDFTNYVLSGGKFVALSGSANIPVGKAYLQIPSVALTRAADADIPEFYDLSEEPEVISMVVSTRGIDGDGETTGIEAIDNGKWKIEDNAYYNLNGQRVENPGKGLYISNGKKVVIK